ncbi:hypothetical protein C8R45DRAFT_946469 [Mycena sanguinolenta]|nr:hypothetical protein C8R45DRAFT_946469 [Mycena sanguinolenta]
MQMTALQGLSPGLWLRTPQAQAQAPAKPGIWLGLACQATGLASGLRGLKPSQTHHYTRQPKCQLTDEELDMVFHFELVNLDSLPQRKPLIYRAWKLSEFTNIVNRWQTCFREEGFWNAALGIAFHLLSHEEYSGFKFKLVFGNYSKEQEEIFNAAEVTLRPYEGRVYMSNQEA